MVEQSNAAAESLADEAGRLAGNVQRFRLGDSGTAPRLRPVPLSAPAIVPAPAAAPRLRAVSAVSPVAPSRSAPSAKAAPADDWSEF